MVANDADPAPVLGVRLPVLALVDEGWLRRWLTSTAHEGSQRPPGEQMLPWLYELFAPERSGVPPEPCMPTVLASDSPGAERLLSAPAAYMLACCVGAPRLRSGWRRLFNLATEGRSFHRLLLKLSRRFAAFGLSPQPLLRHFA